MFFWWMVYISVFWCLASIASVTGTILSITIPALYNRYQDHIDRFAGLIHQQMSHHYKIVDENVISRIPRSLSKDKDSWTFSCRWITWVRTISSVDLSFVTCSFHSEKWEAQLLLSTLEPNFYLHFSYVLQYFLCVRSTLLTWQRPLDLFFFPFF